MLTDSLPVLVNRYERSFKRLGNKTVSTYLYDGPLAADIIQSNNPPQKYMKYNLFSISRRQRNQHAEEYSIPIQLVISLNYCSPVALPEDCSCSRMYHILEVTLPALYACANPHDHDFLLIVADPMYPEPNSSIPPKTNRYNIQSSSPVLIVAAQPNPFTSCGK